jgi:hypothetical protein
MGMVAAFIMAVSAVTVCRRRNLVSRLNFGQERNESQQLQVFYNNAAKVYGRTEAIKKTQDHYCKHIMGLITLVSSVRKPMKICI